LDFVVNLSSHCGREKGLALGVLPPKNPLEGIETDEIFSAPI
jgi:hypothetical protein